jgi:hypothetical protein
MIIKHVYANCEAAREERRSEKLLKKESSIGHFSHFSGNRANETHTPS